MNNVVTFQPKLPTPAIDAPSGRFTTEDEAHFDEWSAERLRSGEWERVERDTYAAGWEKGSKGHDTWVIYISDSPDAYAAMCICRDGEDGRYRRIVDGEIDREADSLKDLLSGKGTCVRKAVFGNPI